MFREVNGIGEKTKEDISSTRLLGETLELEEYYLEKLESNWTIEQYIDEYQIEHIRCFHNSVEMQNDNECWEILPCEGEEAPLELLIEIE